MFMSAHRACHWQLVMHTEAYKECCKSQWRIFILIQLPVFYSILIFFLLTYYRNLFYAFQLIILY
jgi:hypothetical protein